jgi:NAD(P)-dependent dehydrogenase (short-subunit alcohol dehydrogenase family)
VKAGRAAGDWPAGYRALVIGASGGIGAALVERLSADPQCASVDALHRSSTIPIDFADEDSIAAAAKGLGGDGPYHLVVNAVGLLHTQAFKPEKKLGDLNAAQMMETFRINAFGPALVLRHFAPLLHAERSLMTFLSAKVGSIGDNRLGGWYSYRASKAALNMIVKTAAIELARTKPGAVVVAMHPGTVDTGLSRPFGGERLGRPPSVAAREMLDVMSRLGPQDSGSFLAYDGTRLPW